MADAAGALARGVLRPEELVEACLARIEARDAEIHAWVDFDASGARERARRSGMDTQRGPLHGIPIAVKDIIDTEELATERGSELFAGRRPERDAACVALLRAAGALVLGKSVTTEFAYFAPGPTANPHNPLHTPGGSSSGSAAAVADFQVPCALGTQTAGSMIRPAAFNGVFGFKPSFGMFPLEGVLPLAPSLDTLGLFCRDLSDLSLLGAALTRGRRFHSVAPPATPRVALLRTPYWSRGDNTMCASLEALADTLRSEEVPVVEIEAPALEGLAELQNTLLAAEAGETLGPVVAVDPSKTRPETRALLAQAAEIEPGFPTALEAGVARAGRFLRDDVFTRADLVLTPAAVGEAPVGLDATGDPLFNRIWTLLGLPCVSVPIGRGERGLPLAAQFVGPRDRDEALIAGVGLLLPHTKFAIDFPDNA